MEYAPTAIFALFDAVHAAIPDAVLSGILGDQAHTYGYHRCRDVLPSGDYSVQLGRDQVGDGEAASALDISLPPALMITVTNRLLAAARVHDPRLATLREFCGTTDGVHTHPYDLATGQDGPLDSWDSSHLWHVHLSFFRVYATNAAAIGPIAAVIAGTHPASPAPPVTPVEDEDMKPFFAYASDTKVQYLITEDAVRKLQNDAERTRIAGMFGIPDVITRTTDAAHLETLRGVLSRANAL